MIRIGCGRLECLEFAQHEISTKKVVNELIPLATKQSNDLIHTQPKMLLRVDPANNLPPVIYQLAFTHSVAYPSSWLARSLEAQPLALERNKPMVADKSSWIIHLVNQVTFDLSHKTVRVELTEESYHEPINVTLSGDSLDNVASIVTDVQDACALAREEQEQAKEIKNRSLELSRSRSSSTSSNESNQSNNFIASVFSIFGGTGGGARSDASNASHSRSSSPTPSSTSSESGKISGTQSPSRLLRTQARAKLADAFRRYVLPALKTQLVGVAEEHPEHKSNIDYYEFLAYSKIKAHEREVDRCYAEGKALQRQMDVLHDPSHRSRKGALAVLQESLISNNTAPSLRTLKTQADSLNKRRQKLENKTVTLRNTLDSLKQYTAKREAIAKEHAAELESASLRRNGLLMASQVSPKPASFAPRRSSPLKQASA
ncbi:hypothetical protein E3P86_00417 [Wallemia ichthyophaga]|uniref:Uncharacterized protein n=1 Tax=Wallemia ichthyophaga TaxID=245174 RepID=A0A4T0JJD0_WALIC|nr:hypothetical protein E3P86_00417 [Wallemia ichthyophaga]